MEYSILNQLREKILAAIGTQLDNHKHAAVVIARPLLLKEGKLQNNDPVRVPASGPPLHVL